MKSGSPGSEVNVNRYPVPIQLAPDLRSIGRHLYCGRSFPPRPAPAMPDEGSNPLRRGARGSPLMAT
jgi:hypothetical protein